MFESILIANRGAVAARIVRACKVLGVRSICVYSEADADLPFLKEADEAHEIGPGPAPQSYLDQEKVLALAAKVGARAIHPGYGFLSENADFAEKVIERGIAFVGPSPRFIRAMGHKTRARDLAAERGLPVAPGTQLVSDNIDDLLAAARTIGYPLMVKPAGGGGGIGMLPVHDESQLAAAVERSRSMAQRGFANAEIYLEKLMRTPRHIEFQVVGDRAGNVRHVFERDCSAQRRNQKIIEEAVAPGVPRDVIEALGEKIARVLTDIGYDNIGTVEMLMDADGTFSFLEMNTRLQVEHGVTEEVTGIDLVASQIRLAAGEPIDAVLPVPPKVSGHAVQARVYAEDPKRFLPSPGVLSTFRVPEGIRVETGYGEGCRISTFYDPLVAKVIAHGATRAAATERLSAALDAFVIEGVKTNIPALQTILRSQAFRDGQVHTGLVGEVMAA
ncbi:acetyl-CoA carboxylase biotin carboxylase subunit [Xanthobacter tagetidis]|uniref:ATP-grasp domain-containing protein n=1 Tax=Xanthobacter tagetidis TaxID=60216 RepID=A0A3L7AFS4_9HYPH|nr:biotin carboxylase N-terminal domain-containing protein [Xanthobacter tagetidis]MBB6305987.1 acetyl-CoA carboxylase biotin carboxylase subunit [Xanthobacter tagetidis]RLP78501.1 ATP-grasp domain-containing protein [Xanthobacter tagetidis]